MPGARLPADRGVGPSGGWARVLAMTSGLSQQPAVPSRVERLVERAMAFAIDERDDVAVARLAWLAQDDHVALEEASEVCLENTEVGPAVRGRAAGLLARVRHHDLAARPAGRPRPRPGPARQPAAPRAASGPRPTSSRSRRRPPSMRNQAV